MLKIIDRSGKIMVMRPDCTTPIARVAATKLKTLPLPQRLYYADGVSLRRSAPGRQRDRPVRRGAHRSGGPRSRPGDDRYGGGCPCAPAAWPGYYIELDVLDSPVLGRAHGTGRGAGGRAADSDRGQRLCRAGGLFGALSGPAGNSGPPAALPALWWGRGTG